MACWHKNYFNIVTKNTRIVNSESAENVRITCDNLQFTKRDSCDLCVLGTFISYLSIYIHFISTQMKNETTTTFNLRLWYVIFGSWSFVCVFKQTVVLRCSFFIFQNLWFDIRTHLYQLSIAVGTVSINTHNSYIHRNFAEMYERKKRRNNSERRSFAYCVRQWMSMRWKWQTNSQTKASALFTQRVRDFVFVLVLRILHYFLFC